MNRPAVYLEALHQCLQMVLPQLGKIQTGYFLERKVNVLSLVYRVPKSLCYECHKFAEVVWIILQYKRRS